MMLSGGGGGGGGGGGDKSATKYQCRFGKKMQILEFKRLSNDERAEVHKWLNSCNINRVRLHREFSDVLPVAELMKQDYPRLIDLNNFPKRNSVQHKLTNWDTFNFRFLNKFNMVLHQHFMLQLARGMQGAAEVLLHELMRLKKRQKSEATRNAILAQEQVWEENDEVKTVVVNKQVGDGIVQVPQKMILFSLYEKLTRDIQSRDHIIEEHNKRIAHMESIIKIKTERIDELLMQTGKLANKQFMGTHQGNNNNNNNNNSSDAPTRNPSHSTISFHLTSTRKRHPNTPATSD